MNYLNYLVYFLTSESIHGRKSGIDEATLPKQQATVENALYPMQQRGELNMPLIQM